MVEEKQWWNCCCFATFSSFQPLWIIPSSLSCIIWFLIFPPFLIAATLSSDQSPSPTVFLPSLRFGPIVVGRGSNLRLNQTPERSCSCQIICFRSGAQRTAGTSVRRRETAICVRLKEAAS